MQEYVEEMEVDKGKESRFLPRNVYSLGLVSFLNDLSSEVTIRILPLFLSNVLGVKISIIGLIEGVAESTSTLLRIFSGWLSDRLNKRKPLVVLGYGLSSFVKPLLYFAYSWLYVFGIRFADRLGKGIRTAARDALIADSCGASVWGRAFSFQRAMDTAGSVLGLLMAAGLIYYKQKGMFVLTQPAYQLLVILAVIPAILCFITLLAWVKETPRPIPIDPPDRNHDLVGLGKPFKKYLFIIFAFTLGNSSDAFLILRAQHMGMDISQIFLFMAFINIVASLSALPAGILSDRIGRQWLINLGWLIYALVYLGFAAAGALWYLWFLFPIYGLYYGLTKGVERALVADLVPVERRGTAFGLFNAAIGIGALPASLLAGWMWQVWGARAPFFFGAIMAFIALASFNLIHFSPRQQPFNAENKYLPCKPPL
jgi:MFS family permease